MKNLTNLQLQILSNEIYSRIELKKEEYKKTAEYAKIVEKAKKDISYEERIALINKYQKISNKIDELEQELSIVKDAYQTKYHKNYLYNLGDALAEDALRIAVEKNITQFPTKAKIESDIVLASLSGAENIIEAVLNKYAL